MSYRDREKNGRISIGWVKRHVAMSTHKFSKTGEGGGLSDRSPSISESVASSSQNRGFQG